jgi:YD repeat-containing protein
MEKGAFTYYNQSYMGNLAFIQEPNGNRITLTYDGNGRMVTATDSSKRTLNFSYELAATPFVGLLSPIAASQSPLSCLPKGQFALLENRLLKSHVGQAWRVNKVTGPGGLEIDYKYDTDGNLASCTRKGNDTISQATTDYTWQYAYKPDLPSGTTSSVDRTHLLKSVTDPSGNVTGYIYDFATAGTPVNQV